MAPLIRQKTDLLKVLKRAGFPPETIGRLGRELPEKVDLDKQSRLLSSYRVTRDALMSRMGSSP